MHNKNSMTSLILLCLALAGLVTTGYAQSQINTVRLNPGQSVEVKCTDAKLSVRLDSSNDITAFCGNAPGAVGVAPTGKTATSAATATRTATPTKTPMPTAPLGTPATPFPTAGAVSNGVETTFNIGQVPFSAPELVNPLRGLYKWMGNSESAYAQLPRPAYDAYARYTWRELEPTQENYNFTILEQNIAKAFAEGRKYGFRVRTVVSTKQSSVPDYAMDGKGWWADFDKDGTKDTYVPDWNDAQFISRMTTFYNALGAKYDNDPRIAWMDIGMYGNWGEWHMSSFSYPSPTGATSATDVTLQKYIDFQAAAFPNTQIVMMTDNTPGLVYAMNKYPTMGWRRDSLGWDTNHFGKIETDTLKWNALKDRWKVAPVITEFVNPRQHTDPDVFIKALEESKRYHVSMVGNGNMIKWTSLSAEGKERLQDLGKYSGYRFSINQIKSPLTIPLTGSFTLQSTWTNVGNAPAYEPWEIAYQLRTSADIVVWEGTSALDLRTMLPGTVTTNDGFTLGDSVNEGTYKLVITVRDSREQRPLMQLASQGVQDDGSYSIGQIQIGGAGSVGVPPLPSSTPQDPKIPTVRPSATAVSVITPIPTSVPAESRPIVRVASGASIQTVINAATGPLAIQLEDGVYAQDISINKPNITITGSRNAKITGAGNGRVIEITANNVILDGFTLDGKKSSGYQDKLLYVRGTEVKKPRTGIEIRNMLIQNSGGECVRLRYYVQGAQIDNNTIMNCGQDDFQNDTHLGKTKNGEGVYIGTAPEQQTDGKNPSSDPDLSMNNHIIGNDIQTHGNECVDIKENATNNLVELNNCAFQSDPESGGFESRGNNNIFANNTIRNAKGAGIRLGGDTADQGINNSAFGNTMSNIAAGGIKMQRIPQNNIQLCENVFTNVVGGDGVGTFAKQYDLRKACQR